MAVLIAFAVGVGGTLGALARVGVGARFERRGGDTLVVNVLGSLLLGVVLAAPTGGPVRLAAGVGFCGAFTTFSSFAVDTVGLAEAGHPRRAAVYAVGTLGLAASAVLLGASVWRWLAG